MISMKTLSACLRGIPFVPSTKTVREREREKLFWIFWSVLSARSSMYCALHHILCIKLYIPARNYDWIFSRRDHHVAIISTKEVTSARWLRKTLNKVARMITEIRLVSGFADDQGWIRNFSRLRISRRGKASSSKNFTLTLMWRKEEIRKFERNTRKTNALCGNSKVRE